MARISKKQASTDVTGKSVTSSSVVRRNRKVIAGKDVAKPSTASSKVKPRRSKAAVTSEKASPSKLVESKGETAASAKGKPGRPAKPGKEAQPLSRRAKLQKTIKAVSAAKAVGSVADDEANSEADAGNLSTQEAWQRAGRKLRARKGGMAMVGKDGAGVAASSPSPAASTAQVQPRKLTIRNVTAKTPGSRSTAARKIAGMAKPGSRHTRARSLVKMGSGDAQSAQLQQSAALAAQAQQVASKKAAGGGLKAIATAISAAIGVPIGTMILIVLSVIVVISLIATLVAVFVGKADSERFGQMNEIEAAVAQRLLDMGFDNVHTAAIMGNIYGESSFVLDSTESGGPGLGLMSWSTASSHARLFQIAKDKGKPWTDLEVQLQMMEEWINNWNYANSYTIKDKLYGYDSTSWDPEPGTVVSASRSRFDASNDLRECVDNFCYGCEAPGIPRIKVRFEKAEEYLNMLENPSAGNIELEGGELGDPLTGCSWTLTSSFGYRSFDNSFHTGLDMAAPSGTPYYAAESGTVLYATNDGGYNGGAGNWVVIQHDNGIVTKYMHSSATFVRPGDHVNKGDHIGNVGTTGASTGPHLHFQVEVNGTAVDPAPYIGR